MDDKIKNHQDLDYYLDSICSGNGWIFHPTVPSVLSASVFESSYTTVCANFHHACGILLSDVQTTKEDKQQY